MIKAFSSRLSDFWEMLLRHPARVTGALAGMGDLGMMASGLFFNNIGRVTSGFFGACANMPIFLFSERKRKEGEIDPQDLPFKERIKHVWKFWRYPFEFSMLMNAIQCFAIGFTSGPDTASAVGQAANISSIVSADSPRIFETALGVGGAVGSAIGLLREADTSNIPKKEVKGFVPNLKNDWNAVSGFAKNRAQDLASEGLRLDRSCRKAFENACVEISLAGPNKVVAKTFNILIVPWIVESALRGDWSNVASGCMYRVCNYFYARSSKRATVTDSPAPSQG